MDKSIFKRIPKNYKPEVDLDCAIRVHFKCLNIGDCNHSETTEIPHSHFANHNLRCPECNSPMVFDIFSSKYYYKNLVHGQRIEALNIVDDAITGTTEFLLDYIIFYRDNVVTSWKKKGDELGEIDAADRTMKQLMLYSKAFLRNNFEDIDFDSLCHSNKTMELANQLYGEGTCMVRT
ncbi:hypothetical protein [Carboxylicivirga sp. RSCT41]|uniref:hypothetical protein n=1 Tax=Carboxylicivirga agarovorans TaxID=3417570 RepID=UPI003D34593A